MPLTIRTRVGTDGYQCRANIRAGPAPNVRWLRKNSVDSRRGYTLDDEPQSCQQQALALSAAVSPELLRVKD
jgi:hypothetical protein